MIGHDRDLDARVAALLADPQYEGHPLCDALAAMQAHMACQLARIEKVTALSIGFQMLARRRELSMAEQFDRQLRRHSRHARAGGRDIAVADCQRGRGAAQSW